MPKAVVYFRDQLVSHLTNIDKTRKKSEALYRNGQLVNRDVDLIYSGLFIEAVTSFEKFIEELFTSLLTNEFAHPSKKVKSIASFASISIARKMIHGERLYLDWLPFEKYTKKRAKAYFKKGLPFTGLDKLINVNLIPSNDKKIERITERISIIRNVLAHKSKQSWSRFENEIINKSGALHSREKNPPGYLRGLHTSHPIPQTRYEQIILDIKQIASLITSKQLK